MAVRFKNKYRIPSTRLPYWDYGSNAAYFITICTKHRQHFFGEILNGEIKLSLMGKIVEKYWYEIPVHFPFVKLDAFVIMPNHIHGIIIIDRPDVETNMAETPNATEMFNLMDPPNMDPPNVETSKLGVSTQSQLNIASKKWKPGTLAVIVNQYKRICTKNARLINPLFAWQSRYYDHIIRNEKSFYRIVKYINSNPQKWQQGR